MDGEQSLVAWHFSAPLGTKWGSGSFASEVLREHTARAQTAVNRKAKASLTGMLILQLFAPSTPS
jgi:hypothetical protein